MDKFINVRDLNELYSLHQNEPVGTFAEILRSGPDNLKGFSIKSPKGWTSVYYYNSPEVRNTFPNGITAESLSNFYSGILVREDPNESFLGFSSYITYLNTNYPEKKLSMLDNTISFQKVTEEVNDFTPGGQLIAQGASSINSDIYLIILKGSTIYYENYYYKFTDEPQTDYTLTRCVVDPFYPNHYCFAIISGTYAQSDPVYYILTEKTYASIPNLTVEQSLTLPSLDTYDISVINQMNIDLNETGTLNVIGATDIDLGFTGTMTVDADNEPGSLLHIKDIDSILITSKNEVTLNANDTLGNFTRVELSTTELNLESNAALTIAAQDNIDINGNNTDTALNISGILSGNISSKLQLGVSNTGLIDNSSKARFWFNRYPIDHLNNVQELDGAWGVYFRKAWFIPAQYEYVGLQINNSKIEFASTKSGAPLFNPLSFEGDVLRLKSVSSGGSTTSIEFREGGNGDILIGDTRPTKQGIEYDADYSADLKTNPRSLIDAGTMRVMLEDYIAASPSYVDNAAAVTAGLAVGKMYKTPTGELRIVV